jgi:hypothetical protein
MKAKVMLILALALVMIRPGTAYAVDPEAHTMPTNVTDAGATLYTFTVLYSDDGELVIDSLSDQNVRVIGPGGFDAATAFISATSNGSGSQLTATYAFVPPGWSWDFADNGTYSLVMLADAVVDLLGNPVAAGVIGTFTVMTPPGTPSPTPTPGIFGNISTRLRVETGNNILIGGFIVTGTQPKRVIVRAIGPSLSSFFSGVLTDPVLELRDSGALIRSNDNWRSDQEAEIIATTIPPSNDLESAIVATLPANNSAYTAIVRGVNDISGIGVVEAYDLDQTVDSKLANISTRGLVQTGNNILIGGLIVSGQGPRKVLVRAIGPSLPVTGELGDPMLELRDANGGLIAANDNWRSDQHVEILATTIPPAHNLESAILQDLTPGSYTAIVRGAGDTSGIAVVEAYALN